MAPAGKSKPAGGRAGRGSASGKAAASKRPPLPDVEDLLGGSERIARVRDDLLGWYDANHRVLPWRWNPRSQLSREALAREAAEGRRPPPADLSADDRVYRVWVCEVMSQQTQLSRVVEKFKDWIERWPDVRALARASEDEVQACWAGLGYYRRARALLEGAKKVVRLAEEREKRGGEVGAEKADAVPSAPSAAPPSLFPSSAAELQRSIPGIGPYTASAIASNALGEPVAAVDGNVQRVLARLGAIDADPASATGAALFAALADRLLARARPGCWNQALMELGAVVCLPNGRERCGECPLRDECRARLAVEAHERARKPGARTSPPPPAVASYPRKAAKAARRETTVTAVVVRAPVLCEIGTGGDEGEEGTGGAAEARGRTRSTARAPSSGSSSARTISKARPSAVLLARRPEGGLLGGLWEFPGVERSAGAGGGAAGRAGAKGASGGSGASASGKGPSGKKRASKAADSSDEEILFVSSEEEEEEEEAEFGESSSGSDSDASFDSDAAPWEEEEAERAARRKNAARRKGGGGGSAGRIARVTRSQSASGSGSGAERGTLLGFFARKGGVDEGGSAERAAGRDGACRTGSPDENAGWNDGTAKSGKGGPKRSPAVREAGPDAGSGDKPAKRAKRGAAEASVKEEVGEESADGGEKDKGGRDDARLNEAKEGAKARAEVGAKREVEKEEVEAEVKAEVDGKETFAASAPAVFPESSALTASSNDALSRALCLAATAAAAAAAPAAAAPLSASEAAWLAALRAAKPIPLGSFVHVFSHIKMTVDVLLVDLTGQDAVGVPRTAVDDPASAPTARDSTASAPRASRWLRGGDVAEAGLTSSVLKTWKLVQTHDAKAKAKAKNGIGRFFGRARGGEPKAGGKRDGKENAREE